VARMLTPMMAAYLLKPNHEEEKQPRLLRWYIDKVTWCLQHRLIVVIVSSVVMGVMLSLFRFLPTGFAPAGDNGFTQLSVELPPGARLGDTLRVREQARRIISDMPEVSSVFTTVGSGSGGSVRSATLTIQLDNPDGVNGLQQLFERKAADAIRVIPGARLQFQGGGGGDRL